MSEQEEWGPWIEHDGKGFPTNLYGVALEVIAETYLGRVVSEIGVTTRHTATGHWDWSNFGKPSQYGWMWSRVLRYRIRKPRGMAVLEALLQDLPEEIDA